MDHHLHHNVEINVTLVQLKLDYFDPCYLILIDKVKFMCDRWSFEFKSDCMILGQSKPK